MTMPPLDFSSLAALVTLVGLEVVLNIDNLVFIAIMVDKLPREKQNIGRRLGVALALITRLALLFSITWIMSLKKTLFSLAGLDFSGHDLVLILGGLFLIVKAVQELRKNKEESSENNFLSKTSTNVLSVAVQIAIIDIVFSLDSVITAVGMAKDIVIMIAAIVIAMFVMLFSAAAVANFIQRYPTIKVLALSFLILIGATLMIEGFGIHVDKAYIYFAMGFSLLVEFINMKQRK